MQATGERGGPQYALTLPLLSSSLTLFSHTWHPLSQELPLGPPVLMTSTTAAHPGPRGDEDLLAQRKEKMGIDTEAKEEFRKSYLDPDYKVIEGADHWETSGEAKFIEIGHRPYKMEGGEMSKAGNGDGASAA